MADYYVRATDGDNGNAGTPGAPFLNLKGFESVHSPGDRCFTSYLHSYNYGAGTTLQLADDVPASPCELLCIEDWGAETNPANFPHSLSTGAFETSGGTNNFTVQGSFYAYGHTLEASPTLNTARQLVILGAYNHDSRIVLERCVLKTGRGQIRLGSHAGGYGHLIHMRNCQVEFAHADAFLELWDRVVWENTFAQAAVLGTAPTNFIVAGDQYRRQPSGEFVGLDLSNVAATIYSAGEYMGRPVAHVAPVLFHRCRLPSGVVLAALEGACVAPVTFNACDHGTNFIRQAKMDYNGTVTEDTVRIRDNSNSAYSHKLVSSAYSLFYAPLRSFPVARYNVTEGSAITVRVDVLTDNVTLTDGEFWIEVNYLGNASYPLGSLASSAKANILASASNLATSSEGWTTTDLSTPVKQYATVTFTPQQSGIVEIVACLAKTSTTVYVDPDVMVS